MEVKDYYQENYFYKKSRSNHQLKGHNLSKKEVEDDCYPVVTNEDLKKRFGISTSISGKKLDPEAVAHPCGLVAATYVNDVFVQLENKN